MDKTKKVFLLANIILIGFVISVVIYYILAQYLHFPYPFNTFLFLPENAFGDFLAPLNALKDFAPYKEPNVMINYFPLAYIIMFPFSLIKNSYVAYAIFASIFLIGFTYLSNKNVQCESLTKIQNFQNVFIITFLSLPVLYILDRGNFDMLIFFLFAGFIYAFKSEKYLLSAILLAVENAIKPFPFLFLLLFLQKKKYKEFFLSLILTGILIFSGFSILKGAFFDQITVFIQDLYLFKMTNILDTNLTNGMSLNSSMFTALKFIFSQNVNIIPTMLLVKIYNYISLFVAAFTLIFAWREKIFWKKITLLSFLMLLLPYMVVDYKLIFLFVPIWLFFNAEEQSKFDGIYTVLFGLILIPKKIFLFWVHKQGMTQLLTYGILINPLIMLIFIGLIIYEQIQSNKTKLNA